jgi:hypothetical protein
LFPIEDVPVLVVSNVMESVPVVSVAGEVAASCPTPVIPAALQASADATTLTHGSPRVANLVPVNVKVVDTPETAVSGVEACTVTVVNGVPLMHIVVA